jgi:hypothetical protein
MSRTGSDLCMIRLRPTVCEHPEKPRGVGTGFASTTLRAIPPAWLALQTSQVSLQARCAARLRGPCCGAHRSIRRDGRGDQERRSRRQIEVHLLPLQRELCVDLRKQISHDFCHLRVNRLKPFPGGSRPKREVVVSSGPSSNRFGKILVTRRRCIGRYERGR